MKTSNILFFVRGGRVDDDAKTAATSIAAASGKRVVFRNATVAKQTNENPEPCAGVAGLAPDNYKERFPFHSTEGVSSVPEGGLVALDAPVELNSLGLPVGCPDDRDALKEALKAEGVDFHPNNKTETLVNLFKNEVLAKQETEEPEA